MTDTRRTMSRMSETPSSPTVPPWTLGWRLQRSLDFAHISVEGMAHELGVSRSTISRWMNDKGAPPRPVYVRAWAEKCAVPLEWLADDSYRATTRQYAADSRLPALAA